MVAVPEATPVTSPPGELIVASVDEDDHPREDDVMVLWVPSEYVAVAVSWTVPPTATVAAAGLMKIELTVGLMKKPLQLPKVTQRKPAVKITRILAARDNRTAGNIMVPS